jgi:hypothetical protein
MAHRTSPINEPGGAHEAEGIDAIAPDGPEPRAQSGERRAATTAPEPVHRAPTPFVWQHGRRLLLLDDEHLGWVLAELRFDVEHCRYIEVRRATYRWPREAVGAILSRALASGDDAAEESARSLHQWLSRYYGIRLYSDPPPQIDPPEFSA